MAVAPISNSMHYGYRNLSFGQTNDVAAENEKPLMTKNTKIVLGAALAALAAAGMYVVSRGRTKINPDKNIQNVIKSFTEMYPKLAENEAKITKLKNGKTKIEFQRPNNDKEFLICDKDGNFEKRIRMSYDDDGKVQAYTTFKNFDNCVKDQVKSFYSFKHTNEVDGKKIKFNDITLRKYEDDGAKCWEKNIKTKKSDKYIHVENGLEYIPGTENRGVDIKTLASINAEGKPQLVHQKVIDRIGKISEQTFSPALKPEKTTPEKNPFGKDMDAFNIKLAD